jgi:hypothetical protein
MLMHAHSNCISGLCCACHGENKDRPECKDGVSLKDIVSIGDDFPLKKYVEDRLDDANIDELCTIAPIFLRVYHEELVPCDGANPAYTFAPPVSTRIAEDCQDYTEDRQWTRTEFDKCKYVETYCGVTSVALEAGASSPTWNEDPSFLSCLDTIACGCNLTTSIPQCNEPPPWPTFSHLLTTRPLAPALSTTIWQTAPRM